MQLNAIVIGATGLIGTELVQQLINHPQFETITILTRRPTGVHHEKLIEILVDFDEIEQYKANIQGDVLFSTMGTTLKKAGGKTQQYKIDFTYQYEVAQIAAQNKIPNYVLVSAIGANTKANVFYSKMKGELDEAVQQLDFTKIRIFRPSILDGNRKEKRNTEQLSLKLMRFLTKYMFKKYKPTKDSVLAKAMIDCITLLAEKKKVQIFELDEIDQLIQ